MKKIIDTITGGITTVIFLGGYMYLGARMAQISSGYENGVFVLIILFLYLYVAMLLHIVLHEGAHLLAGLATGYEFISFRIGSFIWIKGKDKKLHLKKMKMQGTGGQCLMCPPMGPVEECPYVWYHLSGGLMNLGLGAIGIFLYTFLLPENCVTFALFEEFGMVGVVLGLNNLIPHKTGGTQNDGYNLMDLGRNMDAKKCINIVLRLNALLTAADTFSDLPQDVLDEIKSMDFSNMNLTNASIANAFHIQTCMYFAEKDYDKVYELQKRMMDTPGVLEIFKNEAKCECLFYELTHEQNKEVIEELYDKKLQRYIKATAMSPSKQRLLYAYYHLYLKDEKKAEEAYAKLEKSLSTHSIKAEAVMELELVTQIRDTKI